MAKAYKALWFSVAVVLLLDLQSLQGKDSDSGASPELTSKSLDNLSLTTRTMVEDAPTKPKRTRKRKKVSKGSMWTSVKPMVVAILPILVRETLSVLYEYMIKRGSKMG